MQDYKSLCAAVMICTTLVNIQTDRHTGKQTHGQTAFLTTLYKQLNVIQQITANKMLKYILVRPGTISILITKYRMGHVIRHTSSLSK